MATTEPSEEGTSPRLEVSSHAAESPEGRGSWGPVHVVGWLDLLNHAELARQLAVHRHTRQPDLVAAAFRRWGQDCATRLHGAFAFVAWDAETLFAARDSVGARPLFVAQRADALHLATSLALLAPTLDAKVSRGWAARYIMGCPPDVRRTAFVGIERLPPGHWLKVERGRTTTHRYHRPDPVPAATTERAPEWLDHYGGQLLGTVQSHLTGTAHGLELTGGLDSTSIAVAAAAANRAEELTALTFSLDTQDGVRALTTAQRLGIGETLAVSGRRVFRESGAANFWQGVSAVGHPVEHPNATSHIPLYELCRRNGVRALLSGFGGDEGVTTQAWPAFAELRAAGHRRAALATLPGNTVTRAFRYPRANSQPAQARSGPPAQLLRPELRPFLPAPGRRQSDSVNAQVLRDVTHPWTVVRLEQCSLVAAEWGINYRWPLLDPRLLQAFLSAPTVWKRHHGVGRYLHRSAVARWMDSPIVWAHKSEAARPLDATSAASFDPIPGWGASAHELLVGAHPAILELLDTVQLRALADRKFPSTPRARQFLRLTHNLDRWFKKIDPELG